MAVMCAQPERLWDATGSFVEMESIGRTSALVSIGAALGYTIASLVQRRSLSPVSPRLSTRIALAPADTDWSNDVALKTAFDGAFPALVEVFVDHLASLGMPKKFLDRTRRLLTYSCVGGKCIRGVVLVSNTRDLAADQRSTFLPGPALVLGWCIEILQASFLVADDIMDDSITRRGKPCWYRLPEVQLDAINDALLLEGLVFWLIEAEFVDSASYSVFTRLFRGVTNNTIFGQTNDLLSQPQGNRVGPEVLRGFSADMLQTIVDYKTGFYTFYLPIAASMLLVGLGTEKQLNVVREVSLRMGRKFQAQDDYLDAFGDEKLIGKIGTDIQDHKCTWLLVKAMGLATADQILVIEENLGKHDVVCIQRIKDLYIELGVDREFEAFNMEATREIRSMINQNHPFVPKVAFEKALQLIDQRTK